jgi:hypothetical protein
MEVDRWNIGPENDRELVEKVRRLLKDIGYKEADSWNGIGGSQKITHIEYLGHGGRLTLETETYIGLTLQGPAGLVASIREKFEEPKTR